MPNDPPDDAYLESLADGAVRFARDHHESESPAYRRRIARLYIKLRLDPSARTSANLGILLGHDRRRIPEIEAAAIAKLRARLFSSNPNHP